MIDGAEKFIREHGFRELRVRYHAGDVARIEVVAEEVARLSEEPLRSAVVTELESLGFKFVTIDLKGFRSGNLNTMIPLEVLRGK